jgi:hypothetical protein
MDRRDHLHVKIDALAAEARIIRKRERSIKWKPLEGRRLDRFLSLEKHRKVFVRREARCSQLALACLRGVPYMALERDRRVSNPPNWTRVWEVYTSFATLYPILTNEVKGTLGREYKAWRKQGEKELKAHVKQKRVQAVNVHTEPEGVSVSTSATEG